MLQKMLGAIIIGFVILIGCTAQPAGDKADGGQPETKLSFIITGEQATAGDLSQLGLENIDAENVTIGLPGMAVLDRLSWEGKRMQVILRCKEDEPLQTKRVTVQFNRPVSWEGVDYYDTSGNLLPINLTAEDVLAGIRDMLQDDFPMPRPVPVPGLYRGDEGVELACFLDLSHHFMVNHSGDTALTGMIAGSGNTTGGSSV